jgi:ribosome-binding factor A
VPGEANKRAHRVGQLIQKELAQMLVDEIRDPRIGFATVTEVRVTDDLRIAKVFVSIYGDDKKRGESLEGLRAASGFLRREIAHRLELRAAPTLSFEVDATLEQASRIDALLSAAADGNLEPPDPRKIAPLPVEMLRNEQPVSKPTKQPPARRNKRRR